MEMYSLWHAKRMPDCTQKDWFRFCLMAMLSTSYDSSPQRTFYFNRFALVSSLVVGTLSAVNRYGHLKARFTRTERVSNVMKQEDFGRE